MPAALSLPRFSTNVRFAAASLLAPQLAGAWAERLFLTPPRPTIGETALDLIDARAELLAHKSRAVATWEWGWKSPRAPAVLLAHGWGGHAAQLRGFVFRLLSDGYRVVAFDQPAHGLSEGRLTSLVDFADVLTAVAERHGPIAGVVAHSLGAAATAFALSRGFTTRRVVLISPPSDVAGYSRRFARWHWMPEPVRRSMQAAIEERYGVRWEELEVERVAARMAARGAAPALVIHDREDRVIPWRQGLRVARAWPGARLLATAGLGHGRILRDDGVIQAAADFIAGRSDVTSPVVPALPHPAPAW
ncbi:MAG: alpha/beta fold hydrolase [Clostridia bacterium]